jgi:glutaconate CoA-transferase subunit B
VILFQREHSTRTLVSRVDFVSAPGISPAGVYRPGGPAALVTGRCVFRFDRGAGRFRLATVHPGQTVGEIRKHTGFEFDVPERVPPTPEPDTETLALLRGQLARALDETYPAFAARSLGDAE